MVSQFNRYAFIAFLTIFVSVFAFAAHAVSISGTASVEIRQAVSVAQNAALSFGVIDTNSNSDLISLSAFNTISTQNGSNIVAGSNAAGLFSAVGSPNTVVSITFSDGVLSGAGQNMIMNNFSHNAGATPSFNADGALTFNVGGNLHVNAAQKSGLYAGEYTVSVNYP